MGVLVGRRGSGDGSGYQRGSSWTTFGDLIEEGYQRRFALAGLPAGRVDSGVDHPGSGGN